MRLIRLTPAAALAFVGACALTAGSMPEQAGSEWVDYTAGILALPVTEQQAVRTAAVREHELEPTYDSAVRLAVVTMSLAQSADELLEALELTEFAAAAMDDSIDPAFNSLLGMLIDKMLERERSLEHERQEKQSLQEQLDALRQLEQELDAR